MAAYKIVTKEAIGVLVGSFNPAIFHPEWLVRHELVPADDIQGASVEIVHQDISKFSFDWLGVDVLRHKFSARTNDPSKFDPLRDLLISIFKILDHTPLKQLGMNLVIDYEFENEETWHKFGDVLAPKTIWQKSLPDRIGLTNLTIQSPRNDKFEGYLQVSIGPIEPKYQARININNHIELQNQGNLLSVPEIIAANWDDAIASAEQVAERTIKEAIRS